MEFVRGASFDKKEFKKKIGGKWFLSPGLYGSSYLVNLN
jgi:hypothetical protein